MAELVPTSASFSCLSPFAKESDLCSLPVQKPLFPCSFYDASVVAIVPLQTLATFDPVDVYGSRGFVSLSTVQQTAETRPRWKQCDNVRYCDGPEEEGQTSSEMMRFRTRWKALIVDGLIYVGVAGGILTQISTELFPEPISYDDFSFGFDQNSRMLFVFSYNGVCELRRFEADEVTIVTFLGLTPVIFQNALLQPDSSQQDVVCYYLKDGDLCGRWQRDEFSFEHVLVVDLDVDCLFSTRATMLSQTPYEFLLCKKGCSTRLLLSAMYPAWPISLVENQTLAVAFLSDGDYIPVTIVLDEPAELMVASVAFDSFGLYFPQTQATNETDITATVAFNTDGDYSL